MGKYGIGMHSLRTSAASLRVQGLRTNNYENDQKKFEANLSLLLIKK